MTDIRTLDIIAGNTAPNTPAVTINSTDGSNRTKADLNCFANITDVDLNKMNVTVRWYNNGTLNLTMDYNNSYANGSLFIAVLDDANTTKGENWSCGLRLFDGLDYSSFGFSGNLTILNTPPTVTLISPNDGNITTNRTPTFYYSGSDDDGDALSYELNLTCLYSGGGTCSLGNRYYENNTINSSTNYTVPAYLEYLIDNGYYYNWTARANDGQVYGVWAVPRNISIQSNIVISLPTDYILFENMNLSESKNTSLDDPRPFVLQNDGNVQTNISVNFTNLFSSASNPSSYFQFKIRNTTSGCFVDSGTLVSWNDAPLLTARAINRMNFTSGYQSGCNNVSVDLLVKIPADEPAGNKLSTVVFTGSLGEPYTGID